MSDRLVPISDVHVDQWASDLPDDHQAKRQAFLDFLAWVADGSGASRFVIAGDLLDVPQKDRSALLPQYSDILDGLKGLLKAGVKVGYVVGNHDSGLIGLDVQLADPPLWIDYPFIVVPSDGRNFLIEHGHLHDPWLWDYARNLAMAMMAPSPGTGGPGVFSLAQGSSAPSPPSADLPLQFTAAFQTSLRDHVSQGSASVGGLSAMLTRDLADAYADVLDADADGELIAERQELRSSLTRPSTSGFSLAGHGQPTDRPFLERLVRLYSVPHWRRSAKHRIPEIAAQLSLPLAGIIMGHTHSADAHDWTEGGAAYQYLNSGT